VALKNPSEYFNKDVPSISGVVQEFEKTPELNGFSDAFRAFKNNLNKIEALSDFAETLDNYKINIERVNHLSSNIEGIRAEIQNLISEEDLNHAMLSHLIVVEQSIQEVQNKVKAINEKNLIEIRCDVANLTESVNEFLEVEVPKYKKLIVENEINISSRYEEFENNINQSIENSGDVIAEVYQEFSETIKENIAIFESRISAFENKNDEKYFQILKQFKDKLIEFEQLSESVKSDEQFQEELSEKVTGLHLEIVRNETHIRVQNKTLQAIQDEVKDTLSKINLEEFEEKSHKLGNKIKYLEEMFDKFSEKEILNENVIVEPPSTNNQDPLTPLDKNYVTLDQLQDHYRLFINRIQQQLATFGGGGETRLEFLDDVDRDTAKQDGYVLQYNSNVGKFIGTSYVPGGGGNVAIAITNIPPSNPDPGNLWYDFDIGRTFLYYTDEDGSQWVDASPSGASALYAQNAGIATSVNGGFGSLTQLSVSGISTLDGTNVSNLSVSGVGTFSSSGLKIRNPANTFGYTIAGGDIAADYVITLPTVTSNTGIAVTGLAQTWSATQTFTTNITFSATTGTLNLGNSQTTGTFTVGGTSGTGTITLGRSTAAQTTNIQAGVTTTGTLKMINLGTGGASGSFTDIEIGPTSGIGSVVINAGTNVGINSLSPTSKLDIVGDAKLTGVITATTFNGQINAGVSTFAGITTVTGPSFFAKQSWVSGVSTVTGDCRVGVSTAAGIVLTSANGTKYRLHVTDAGVVNTVLVP
jgi:hypothetical protein